MMAPRTLKSPLSSTIFVEVYPPPWRRWINWSRSASSLGAKSFEPASSSSGSCARSLCGSSRATQYRFVSLTYSKRLRRSDVLSSMSARCPGSSRPGSQLRPGSRGCAAGRGRQRNPTGVQLRRPSRTEPPGRSWRPAQARQQSDSPCGRRSRARPTRRARRR